MSLRNKIALTLFAAVALFVMLDRSLRQMSFEGRVHQLDLERADERMTRLVAAYENELAGLGEVAESVRERMTGPAHSAAPLAWEPFLTGADPIDFAVLYDGNGTVLEVASFDPRTRVPLTLRDLPTERLSPTHPLMRAWWVSGQSPRGLWVTSAGPALVDSLKVGQEDERPIWLTLGRFLDASLLANLRSRSGVDVEMVSITDRELFEDEVAQIARARAWPASTREVLDRGRLQALSILSDLGEKPVFLLRAEAPRELANLWRSLNQYTLTSSVAIALLFPLAILLLLQWVVTGPLSKLTSHVVRIAQSNDTDARLDMDRGDEIGQLADEFNAMLEKLAKSQAELMQHARQAGRSEISAGVLHNLGNALNSVNVSADLALQELTELNVRDLRIALTKLEEHAGALDDYLGHDERGRHLLPFLHAVADELEGHVGSAHRELETLETSVERVSTLLAALNEEDAPREFVERSRLAGLLDTAVDLCVHSLGPADVVPIERDYQALPSVYVDRKRFLDTVVHLVRNAMQAVRAASPTDPCVRLRLAADGDERVLVEVVDNGVGIAADQLGVIFHMGHTTKGGSTGMGLHLASLLATEMGGELQVESPGPGRGATFRLLLPLRTDVGERLQVG